MADHKDLQKRRLIAAKRLQRSRMLDECFDASKLKSRPNDKQDLILQDTLTLYRIVRCGNQSGKTATMVRDYVWKMKENHPYWKRRSGDECPKCKCINTNLTDEMTESYQCDGCDYEWISWGTQGLTFLVVCQTGKHIDSIWKDRFKPFFADDEVRVDIKGGILQSVTHKKTGNTMIFFSHDNATEVRKRIQYFVAHDVWIDEMPSSYKVYEELMRRVDAMRGQFTATLTPKVSNIEVKEFIDKLDPAVHKLHRMNKLDNPVNIRFKEQELAKLQSMDEATRNAVLYGDWVFAGELRLNIDMKQIQELPSYYSRTWDHVVCIDPASAGKAGFVIFAKDPSDVDTWWVVKALHIKGDAPSTLVEEILPKYTAGLNIVKRVADPHETWFIKESSKSGVEYECPFDKTHRRKELLAGGEEALINPKMFFVAGETTQLVSELNSAVDDPKNPGNIKNATKYHCIDAWIYGLDLLPKYTTPPKPLSPREQLKHDWVNYKKGDRESMMGYYGGQGSSARSGKMAPSAKKAFAKNNSRWSRRR